MSDSNDRDRGPLFIVGLALLVVGVLLLARPYVPFALAPVIWGRLRDAGGPIALIVVGVAVILGSQRKVHARVPEKGTKLYRSRKDRLLGGVIGGLAGYFDVDATFLRLAVVGLALLLRIQWPVFVAYIVMWAVVPEEPQEPVVKSEA